MFIYWNYSKLFYIRRHYIFFVEKYFPLMIPLLKEGKDLEEKNKNESLIESISNKFIL